MASTSKHLGFRCDRKDIFQATTTGHGSKPPELRVDQQTWAYRVLQKRQKKCEKVHIYIIYHCFNRILLKSISWALHGAADAAIFGSFFGGAFCNTAHQRHVNSGCDFHHDQDLFRRVKMLEEVLQMERQKRIRQMAADNEVDLGEDLWLFHTFVVVENGVPSIPADSRIFAFSIHHFGDMFYQSWCFHPFLLWKTRVFSVFLPGTSGLHDPMQIAELAAQLPGSLGVTPGAARDDVQPDVAQTQLYRNDRHGTLRLLRMLRWGWVKS